MPKAKTFILWGLVLFYVCCAISMVIIQLRFEMEVSELLQRGKEPFNLHGILMVVGVCLMGFAMLLFRLFPGVSTRTIKYIHLGLHFLALAFLVAGYIVALRHDVIRGNYMELNPSAPKQTPVHATSMVHYALGYATLGSALIQFIAAMVIFAYLSPNTRMRRFFAPYHDMIGIWIFLGLVAAHTTGGFFLYDMAVGCCTSTSNKPQELLSYSTVPTYFGFLTIFGVIIAPYYEWELVGPI